jgi:glycosyltransferase involved in cell wall biosynthesis
MEICFVCPYAYPLFDGDAKGRFGGSEVRAWHFARGLAKLPGFEVTVAVFDHGQPPWQRIDGVNVIAMASPPTLGERLLSEVRQCVSRQPRAPWVAVRRWRLKLAWQLPITAMLRLAAPIQREIYLRRFSEPRRRRTLERIDADVYCSFGAHHITAETVAHCQRRGCKSVLLLESDSNLSPDNRAGLRVMNLDGELGHVCHYGLAHADQIIAQTSHQQALLRSRFGRDSVLIRDPIELNSPWRYPRLKEGDRRALWIGKSEPYKRPDLCLELARRCPEISFVMVMNRAKPELHERIMAQVPPNVRVIEQVAFSQIERYFAQASVLINTSDYEGFPVTFLQAGKYGVPVASLRSNPDGFLTPHGCGIAAGGDLQVMADAVRRLSSDSVRAAGYRLRISDYVASRHELDGRVLDLAGVLNEVAGRNEFAGKLATAN